MHLSGKQAQACKHKSRQEFLDRAEQVRKAYADKERKLARSERFWMLFIFSIPFVLYGIYYFTN